MYERNEVNMKITNISNFMGYNSNISKAKKQDLGVSKKYDVIQINKNKFLNNENNNSLDIDKLKNKIVDEIKNESKAGKLEFLRQQIKNDSYVVSSEELAKIMLDL